MPCFRDGLPLLGCLLLACATEVQEEGSSSSSTVPRAGAAGDGGSSGNGGANAGASAGGKVASGGAAGMAASAGSAGTSSGSSGSAGTSGSGGSGGAGGSGGSAGSAGSDGSAGSGGSTPTGVVGDVIVSYQPVKKNANEWAEAMIYVDNEGADVALDGIELRYYFDSEYDATLAGSWTVNFSVGYLGGTSIQTDLLGQVVQMAEPTTNADSYVEIKFTGGHTLSADRLSITFWLQPPNYDIAQNQANDFSFDAAHAGTPWALVPARQGSTLIWGADP